LVANYLIHPRVTHRWARSWRTRCSQIPWGSPEVLSSTRGLIQVEPGGEGGDPVVEGSEDCRSAGVRILPVRQSNTVDSYQDTGAFHERRGLHKEDDALAHHPGAIKPQFVQPLFVSKF